MVNMKYNHYDEDPSLFTGIEEVDEDLSDYFDLLAGMAEEIVIRTDAYVKVDYKNDSLTIEAKEDSLTQEAKDLIAQYRQAMPKIAILYNR